MYMHIYIERERKRESNKCRIMDKDRSAKLDVNNIFGFNKSLFCFLVEACILAAMRVFARSVNNPASPSTDHSPRW